MGRLEAVEAQVEEVKAQMVLAEALARGLGADVKGVINTITGLS